MGGPGSLQEAQVAVGRVRALPERRVSPGRFAAAIYCGAFKGVKFENNIKKNMKFHCQTK
jgi:hypothetical protein